MIFSLDLRCHLDNEMSLHNYIKYVKGILGQGGEGKLLQQSERQGFQFSNDKCHVY